MVESVSRCRVGINLLFCLATLSGLFWNLLCRARGDNSIAMSAYTLHSKLSGWGWWGCRYGDGTDCQFIFFPLDFVLPPMTILGWCELDRHHLHNRQFTRWNNVLCRVNFVGCCFLRCLDLIHHVLNDPLIRINWSNALQIIRLITGEHVFCWEFIVSAIGIWLWLHLQK